MEYVEKTYLYRPAFVTEKESSTEITPLSLTYLISFLKEWEEERKRLITLEKEFLATRNTELLKPFYDKFEYPRIRLKEDIDKPVALYPLALLNNEEVITIIEDAKIFDKNIEIREVVAIGLGSYLSKQIAIIGDDVGKDGRDFWAFHNLRNQERLLDLKIRQNKAYSDKTKANKSNNYIR
jgi:hypothetical protein